MDLKEGFIQHLEALIKEGEAILQSKGICKKPDTRNLAGQLSAITLFDDGVREMKQERFNRLRCSERMVFDYNSSRNWGEKIHICFLEYEGEDSHLTKYIKVHLGKNKIEKADVEQIISFLKNINSSEKSWSGNVSVQNGNGMMKSESVAVYGNSEKEGGMNRIILIGNGFDLAHGLQTGYTDFVNALWEGEKNRFIDSLNINRVMYQSSFIQIKCSHPAQLWHHITGRINLSGFSFFLYLEKAINDDNIFHGTNYKIDICWSNIFLHEISKNIRLKNWVDIEREYFLSLHECAQHKGDIKKLNDEFKQIKDALAIYLNSLPSSNINSIVAKHFSAINNIMSDENKAVSSNKKSSLLILNFNYTSLASLYLQNCFKENRETIKLIPIHGELGSNENPILFGYGDTTSTEYSLLQKQNIDNHGYLEYIKPLKHLQNTYYQQLLAYVESNEYEVHIMGHSCGISDKDILKMLFKRDNCLRIHIYYHNKDGDVSDHSEKIENISMCFEEDPSWQKKVIAFSESVPLS